MKRNQFVSQSLTNTIKDITERRNIGYFNGIYYWGVVTTTLTTATLTIYSAPDFTTSPTTVRTYAIPLSGSGNATWYNLKTVTRIKNGRIVVACTINYLRTATYYSNVNCSYCLDLWMTSPTWVDAARTVTSDSARTYCELMDIPIYDNGIFHVGFYFSNASYFTPRAIIFRNFVSSTEDLSAIPFSNPERVYPGRIDGNNYWFIYEYASGEFWLCYVTSSFTGYSTYRQIISLPANWMLTCQQYWFQDGIEILVDRHYFRWRNIGSKTWNELYNATPSTSIAYIWDYENNRINNIIWNDIIYCWLKGGAFVKIQAYASNAYVGILDWFSDGSSLAYKLTKIAFTCQRTLFSDEIYSISTAEITSQVKPILNEYTTIYDDVDIEQYEAYIRSYNDNLAQYPYNFTHLLPADLKTKIFGIYSGSPSKILKDVIDAYLVFLWYGKGNKFNTFVNGLTGWTDSDSASCESKWLESRLFDKVLFRNLVRQYDNNATGQARIEKSPITGCTIFSGYFAVEDTAKSAIVQFYEGATRIGYLALGTNIQWYRSGGSDILKTPTVVRTMYHWMLIFNASSDNVQAYIDGVYIGTYTLENAITTEVNKIWLDSNYGSTAAIVYHAEIYWGTNIDSALEAIDAISPVPTGAYVLEPNGMTFLDIIQQFDNQDGYMTTWTPNGQLFRNQFSPSGISWDASVLPIQVNPPLYESLKYSRYVIYGGFVNGNRLIVELLGEPNSSPFFAWFPMVVDILQLDAIAANIKLKNEVNYTQVTIQLYSDFGLKVGQSLYFTCSMYGLASTFYIVRVVVDQINYTYTYTMVSLYHSPAKYTRANVKNEGEIGKINTDLISILNSIPFQSALFLINTTSAIVGTYKQFGSSTPGSGYTVNATITSLTGTLIEEWITDIAPGNYQFIKGERIEGHFFVYVDGVLGKKEASYFWELYKRTSGGVETLLGTSMPLIIIATSPERIEVYLQILSNAVIDATDYIVIKTYGRIKGSGNDPILYIAYGLTNNSHIGLFSEDHAVAGGAHGNHTGEVTSIALATTLAYLTTKGDLYTRDASANYRLISPSDIRDNFKVLTYDYNNANAGIYWEDKASMRAIVDYDEFLSVASSTTPNSKLHWMFTQSGTSVISGPTIVSLHPGIQRMQTGTTSGNNCRMHLGNTATFTIIIATNVLAFRWIVRIPTIGSMRVGLGLGDDISSNTFGSNAVAFIYNTGLGSSPTYWRVITMLAGAQTEIISSFVVTAGNWYVLEAYRNTSFNWVFYINNSLVGTISTNKPLVALNVGALVHTLSAAAREMDIDYFDIKTNALGNRYT